VLKNIRHRSNNFANDLRLVGIRMAISEVEPPGKVLSTTSVLVTLGPSDFTVGQIQELKPATVAAPPVAGAGGTFLDRLKAAADELVMLKSYFKDPSGNYSGYGLRVDYKSKASLFAAMANCEVNALEVSQVMLFSTYGKSPPHEPGTVLMAARCHPLAIYKLVENSGVDRKRNYQRVDSIRFDYRLHLAVDSTPATANAAPTPKSNNAGLFRDKDSVGVLRGAGGFLQGGRPMAYSKGAFATVEKPLVVEVVAPAVEVGLSAYKSGGSDHWCWDNVHWWGNRGSGPMISTPGAFHAAHMHWRWGSAGSSGRKTIPEIDTTGRPSGLTNLPVSGSGGGTLLVDPRIWIQTIKVAVALNDPSLDPNAAGTALSSLCLQDWKSLFTGLRAKPKDISKGAEIVCWYSAEVLREMTTPASTTFGFTTTAAATYKNKLEGTVFLHGMFFAHEPEITGFGIGDTGPLYWSKDSSTISKEESWYRDAN
jgi:hypothetical protein